GGQGGRVLRAGEEVVDLSRALIRPSVAKEFPDRTGSRQSADNVETCPAKEFHVLRQAGRHDVELFQLGVDLIVDETGGCVRIQRGTTWNRARHEDGRRLNLAGVAD